MKKEKHIKILIDNFNGNFQKKEDIERAEDRMGKLEVTIKRFAKFEKKGVKNADKIKKALEKKLEETYETIQENTNDIKKTLKKMIPKEELKDGIVYEVLPEYARCEEKAKWNKKEGMFIYKRYKWGMTLEDTMDYFGDVAWTNTAGCAPMKIAQKQVL